MMSFLPFEGATDKNGYARKRADFHRSRKHMHSWRGFAGRGFLSLKSDRAAHTLASPAFLAAPGQVVVARQHE
jgi:hypothetical protein